MLILTKQIGESVVIARDIFITVLGMTAKQVRLGIEIPEQVAVEIREAHCDANHLARLKNLMVK
ncbi:carbon storage regulator [Legionella birminghamensis]|uniref:Carbon storage regulator n=1 Tax=Legionella birminghamensis TaxID=28083 RepID=A0A378JU30_9GAMM|nr:MULTISPECIES: carbon storage regulator [Legionella]KTC71816.1 carbon storage regulator [Legionella birminghamensis]MCW8452544.1 carbon storage regulator [Legionella quinlivanii]STX60828.1 csrA [Legionella birminghamensis]